MENSGRNYLAEVEKIIRNHSSPRQAARRIVELRLQEVPQSCSFKEYSSLKEISYRTVQRWAATGVVKVIPGPRPRIAIS